MNSWTPDLWTFHSTGRSIWIKLVVSMMVPIVCTQRTANTKGNLNSLSEENCRWNSSRIFEDEFHRYSTFLRFPRQIR
ncbi:hypothetical protein KC19_5G078400 [Ceratodon purpureus]|uniref:Uncharacterized protein n=1 Tax=Ceratodon purpureus TaxID=3225 RepID=A0A8T0I0J1_CERPU|nr:hypothetical protein KC19_5G078400 [Ceratodon purpureus]